MGNTGKRYMIKKKKGKGAKVPKTRISKRNAELRKLRKDRENRKWAKEIKDNMENEIKNTKQKGGKKRRR